MKTTVELDEKKLKHIMKLAGFKTRRAAIDFALTEAERLAKIRNLFSHPLPASEYKNAVDPAYNLAALREMEKPR